MSRTIYQEKRSMVKRKTSLDHFISGMTPILRGYIIAGEWRETYYYNESSWERTLGDEQNAHLKHSFAIETNPDGYSGDGGYESFRSYQLIHPTTNEKLDVSIYISRLLYSADEIELIFEGEADEVENLKKAVQPALQSC